MKPLLASTTLSQTEHFREPERFRGRATVPGGTLPLGTLPLADIFQGYGGPEGPFPRGKQRNLAEAPRLDGKRRKRSAIGGQERKWAPNGGNKRKPVGMIGK